MADNIKLTKPNFTTLDGYFFTFDEALDALLQKTDDGNTAFSYPVDTVLTAVIQCLEYDGVDFWSMEDKTGGRIFKRWRIDNYVCKLQQTITLNDDGSHTYNVDTFSLEHYHTELTSTVSGGSSTIYVDKYSDSPGTIVGSTLHLGPNLNGEYEDVVVSGTIFGGVTLTTPTTYEYAADDVVNWHKYIWMFNNSDGTDTSQGAVYKLHSHTGAYITRYAGGQYKDIGACTFYTVPSFTELGPVDTLAYVKGTNMLFVDVSEDVAIIADAVDSNDDFTGTNGNPPDPSLWDIRFGSPTIQSNQMYTSTASGEESIASDYWLRGDFEVTITGSLASYNTTYSGAESFEHFLGLLFPNESDRYCYVARANSDELATQSGINNFHVASYKAGMVIEYATSATASGGGLIDDYEFTMSRAGDNISFYYTTTQSGTVFLDTVQMFDTPCKLMLGLKNTLGSTVTANFDDVEYVSGETITYQTATELPFYGSMVMENIQSDLVTVIPVYDLTMDGGNVYRLQTTEDGGGSMSGYNYQLSPLDAFVTSISLSASPAIIAANGLSTSDLVAYVKDQFLQPIAGRGVTFSENGTGSITGGTYINTDSNGRAQTEYQAGTTAQEVTITAVVEQTN